MPIRVHLAPNFAKFSGGVNMVEVRGATVGECLSSLVSQHPHLGRFLSVESGHLPRFVNIYIGQRDIRADNYLKTAVKEENDLYVLAAVAGG